MVNLTSKDDGQTGCFVVSGVTGVALEDSQGSIQTWQPEIRDAISLLFFSVTKLYHNTEVLKRLEKGKTA